MTNQPDTSVKEAFERALGIILTRVCVYAQNRDTTEASVIDPESTRPRIAIAYSGGLDSSALLHLAHDYAQRHSLKLFAFHVHHGISVHADAWLSHCEHECLQLGVHFDATRVTLARRNKTGVEEAARISRYAALGDLCRKYQVPLLLTAHHQDDQAETVLLQLLRGSGVAGLGGMETWNTAPELLNDSDLLVGRPLLSVSRQEIAGFVSQQRIAYVEDESNTDIRYARNALRQQVVPAINAYFPDFQRRVIRTAQHARSAQRLLDQLAAQDLALCADEKSIALDCLRQFDPDRIDNVLRYWFGTHGIRMPSTSWLSEMRTQLFNAREDACIRVTHADCEIRRHRDRVFITSRRDDSTAQVDAVKFRWQGEAMVHFPDFGGSMLFESAAQGIDRNWLLQQDLIIRRRQGGERLKPADNRPTRSLKHHYQSLNIPAWEREHLPIVTTAAGELLFAAGIGLHWHAALGSSTHGGVQLRWMPDHGSFVGKR